MGFIKSLVDKLSLGNTIYFPGCLTRFAAPEIEQNYIKILEIFGVDFIKIPEFNCCGSPVYNAGYDDDFAKLREDNKDVFKTYGVKRVISNCPSCVHTFKNQYGYSSEHITQVLYKFIHMIKPRQDGEEIVYHDPCHLGRGLGVYDEPREIIKALGFSLLEFPSCKKDSMCCGAGGGLKTNNPRMSKEIVKRLLKKSPGKRIVTTCPLCYKHFKENAPSDFEIYELSEIILNRVGEDPVREDIANDNIPKISITDVPNIEYNEDVRTEEIDYSTKATLFGRGNP